MTEVTGVGGVTEEAWDDADVEDGPDPGAGDGSGVTAADGGTGAAEGGGWAVEKL